MSLMAIPHTITYQCSLCVPPDVGRYWLHTTTRSYSCSIHGKSLHYEFSEGILYIDHSITKRVLSDEEVRVLTREPFQYPPTGDIL